jgi:hypothetical protein
MKEAVVFDRICLMVPTYKRSDRLLPRFIDSALERAADPHRIRFSFCVNDADLETNAYLRSRCWPDDQCWEVLVEDSRVPDLSRFFNLLYERSRFGDRDTLVSMLGDDMVFQTPGYDERILDVARRTQGKTIIYCNDAYTAGSRICVNLFTSRSLVSATGKPFMCPLFQADMIDLVWTYVGVLTQTLAYLSETVIKHDHSTAYPESRWDVTSQRLRPLQQGYRNRESHDLAFAYASVVARNLIAAGIGHRRAAARIPSWE